MSSLAETFRTPDSRKTKTLVVIDLTNSTAMKDLHPEASWLTTYGWFFDKLSDYVQKHEGATTKYLGDGVLAVFDEDQPANAINCAIDVQEALAAARAENLVMCECSVGIAYRKVVEFDTPAGTRDYIGTVVDRAFRLCDAANANAVFVDTHTVTAAPMNRVRSRVGQSMTPTWTADEYQSEEQSVTLKGFARPVRYREIKWSDQVYGVRGEFVTKLSSQPIQPAMQSSPVQAIEAGWTRGSVIDVRERFGFIRSSNGEDFWFSAQYMFRKGTEVKQGDYVWFLPADPLPNASSRRATDVLVLGMPLSGRVERVTRDYGFALCQADSGNTYQIFVFFGDSRSEWSRGTELEFDVGENRQGLAGLNPRSVE